MSSQQVEDPWGNIDTEEIVKPKIPLRLAVYVKKILGWLVGFNIAPSKLAKHISDGWGLRNV